MNETSYKKCIDIDMTLFVCKYKTYQKSEHLEDEKCPGWNCALSS